MNLLVEGIERFIHRGGNGLSPFIDVEKPKDGLNRRLNDLLDAWRRAEEINILDTLRYLSQSVPVEVLLADRTLQAKLDAVLSLGSSSNPYPGITMKEINGESYNWGTFLPQDRTKSFIYYIPEWTSREDDPQFLRSQDIVPNAYGSTTSSFDKPLLRVPFRGGNEQRFNYINKSWEATGRNGTPAKRRQKKAA